MPLFGGFAQARNFGKGGAGRPPGFVTPSGSLGTIRGGSGSSGLLSAAATTGPGDPPIQSYSIVSGSLPGGLSFNTSTAAITGTASEVGSETTYNFTVRATSSAGNIDRAFSITIRLPILAAFTSAGANQTWNVPVGVTECEVLVIGGGGSGGNIGGGGGGGGVVLAPAYPVTPGGSVSVTVGAGGTPYSGSYPDGIGGNPSSFGVLTALGGGFGGGYSPGSGGGPGGSGGGAASPGNRLGTAGSQPSTAQPAGVGSYTSYGNQGGSTNPAPISHWGAGGGGAGSRGRGIQPAPLGGNDSSIRGGDGVYFPQYASYGSPGGHFAAGGGGGQWTPYWNYPAPLRAGGTGGGGAGGNNSTRGGNGAGHGSGAGGMGYPAPTGNTGAVGAVFIRY